MYSSLPDYLRPKSVFAGQLDPAFLYADDIAAGNLWFEGERQLDALALSASERHRLVEASKSPTDPETLMQEAQNRALHADRMAYLRHSMDVFNETGETVEPVFTDHDSDRTKTPHNQVGCKTVIEYREWAEEYRIRTEVEATTGNAPPEQGDRVSTMLSTRGAKKIAESCEYMAMKKGGYKTFVTGTFDKETRERIANGETTIQKEVSRTMDAMQKLYLRGFMSGGERVEAHQRGYDKNVDVMPAGELVLSKISVKAEGAFSPVFIGDGGKVWPENHSGLAGKRVEVGRVVNEGECCPLKIQSDKLAYCWVVEVPKNDEGEENPHVHMLLGWGVPYKHFEAWAARIERIWGNGYFHLEKIKDSNCAGSYMAKAAGYLSKAQGADDQGTVTGNRYGISSVARAPAWVKVSESQLHIMGQLIADIYDHLSVVHGSKYRERKRLNSQLEKTPKEQKATRLKIGEQLQKVRESIKEIPIRCNKYQVILKGKVAAARFFTWAKTPDYVPPVDWLPEKPEGEAWNEGDRFAPKQSQYFRAIRRKFQEMKQRRHAVTDEVCSWIVEQAQEFRDWAIGGWSEYENLDLCQ